MSGKYSAFSAAPQSVALRQPSGMGLNVRLTPSFGNSLLGVLQEFVPGEVILALNSPIAEGSSVQLEVKDCTFEGEVLYCRPKGYKYETHVSVQDIDETGWRKTPRFPVNLWARVFASDLEAPLEGKIVDISGEGIGLELSTGLASDKTIAIESESNIALGIVRYQREISPRRFRVGVQLHHVIRKNDWANDAVRSELVGKGARGFSQRRSVLNVMSGFLKMVFAHPYTVLNHRTRF